jgi:DNA-binding transcriptional ArsR family regulator
MTAAAHATQDVFRALADPTRRDVLARLSQAPTSVSELAAPFAMALPSFIEHLKILETSGLVSSKKIGRTRIYQLVPQRLTLVEDWLTQQRNIWERRLDQLDSYLLSLKGKQP